MPAPHSDRLPLRPFQKTTAHSPCPVCGTHSATTIAIADGKTRRPLHTVQCSGCGLGRIDPLPTSIELTQWYSEHYRKDYKGAFEPAPRHVLRAARNAARRWKWLTENIDIKNGAPTLDVGASSGEFVHLGTMLGYASEGIEPNEGYAEFGRRELGVRVVNGTLEQRLADFADRRFELVSAFHVFEHTVDPIGFLRDLRSLLSPTGRIFLEVPDAARLCAPHTMFFRAHTLYFTQQSLPDVARRAGLRVEASNFDNPDDLRVVLFAEPNAATAHALDSAAKDYLLRGQTQRTWLHYGAEQVRTLAPLKKLQRRAEEKRTARACDSTQALLQRAYHDVFGN